MLHNETSSRVDLSRNTDEAVAGSEPSDRKLEKRQQRKRLGERLQQALWQRRAMDPSFDQHALAKNLGVTPQAVSQWLSGTSSPSAHRLGQLAELLQVEISWLRDTVKPGADGAEGYGQGSAAGAGYFFPPREKVTGGAEDQELASNQIVDYLAFKEDWVRIELSTRPENLALITCLSDGMSPTVRVGDLVLVDRSVRKIHIDSIYVFCHGNDLRIKRAQALFNGNIIIKSDNHEFYDEQELSPDQAENLNVFGRVLLVSRRL